MGRLYGLVLVLLLLLPVLLAGCEGGAGPRVEPTVIGFRNSSGRSLDSMTVREVGVDDLSSSRLGHVAPMAAGHTTVFGRPENPPPLPDRATISWPNANGSVDRVDVDLSPVLRDATGDPGEMLVFEVKGPREAVVYLDRE